MDDLKMTKDYTPTTEEIKFPATRLGWWTPEAFDRWLNSVKAEAWDEGYDAGHEDTLNEPGVSCFNNPHRNVG